ncbi:hypothetical protein [Burkholderia gladioli]|uniref:hypothetical protein n=1 Tax=Burkholderia gladioli TaxID=28095 RepID=UPI003132EB10
MKEVLDLLAGFLAGFQLLQGWAGGGGLCGGCGRGCCRLSLAARQQLQQRVFFARLKGAAQALLDELAQQGVEGFGGHGSGLPDVRLLGWRVLVGLLQWISHGVLPEMDVRGPRRESAGPLQGCIVRGFVNRPAVRGSCLYRSLIADRSPRPAFR